MIEPVLTAGTIPESMLRDMLAGMFTGEAGPTYWSRASTSWIATASESRRGRPLPDCGNSILLETFDRLWTASEVARRLAGHRTPDRSAPDEHGEPERAALALDPAAAADALVRHLSRTTAALSPAEGTSVDLSGGKATVTMNI